MQIVYLAARYMDCLISLLAGKVLDACCAMTDDLVNIYVQMSGVDPINSDSGLIVPPGKKPLQLVDLVSCW